MKPVLGDSHLAEAPVGMSKQPPAGVHGLQSAPKAHVSCVSSFRGLRRPISIKLYWNSVDVH